MMSVPKFILCFSAATLVTGCAQPPVSPPPPARSVAAIDANQRAESLVRRGDFENAALQYREALRLAQSIEDADAIAANALNLSVVLQRLGRIDDARNTIVTAVDASGLAFAPLRQAQTALRHAVLDVEQKQNGNAIIWLERADTHCAQGCPVAAAIANLRGRIELDAGRLEAAASRAQQALALARAAGNGLETANALRLAGNAALGRADPAAAIAALGEALAIDRELAQPGKILLDLKTLGRAYHLAGDRGNARSHFERALVVATAERDTVAAAELRQLIAALAAQP
jgi:tetratricopeptide (TPR) repeat protein